MTLTNRNNMDNRDFFKLVLGVVLFLAFCAILATSCNTVKRAVKTFDSHPTEAAQYCSGKFPVKERTVTRTVVKKGKADTVTLAGETLFVDCDSVIVATLDEASRKRVKVPCPPTKIIHVTDTVVTHDSIIRRDVAMELVLQNNVNELTVNGQKLENKVGNRNRWLLGSVVGNLLLLLVVALGVTGRLTRFV